MTTSPPHRDLPRDDQAPPVSEGPPLRVSGPGELLAAIPALLGFVPARSLVVLCLHGSGGRRLGLAARVDLPAPGDTEAVAAQLAVVSARSGAQAVVLVVVDDRSASHREAVEATVEAVESLGIEVVEVLRVARIEAGAGWVAEGARGVGRLHGVQADPRASAVAAAHVVAGRVVHDDRRALAQVLAPDPDSESPARRTLIDAAVAAARRGRRDPGDSACAFADVLAAVARCEDGAAVLDQDLATLVAALDDVAVRDATIALAVGEHADAAERLWVLAVRALPQPYRAAPATLLAVSCYVRGEGPSAGVAVDVALAADPGHRMARLLRGALDEALPPATVRAVAETARDIAARLGVEL